MAFRRGTECNLLPPAGVPNGGFESVRVADKRMQEYLRHHKDLGSASDIDLEMMLTSNDHHLVSRSMHPSELIFISSFIYGGHLQHSDNPYLNVTNPKRWRLDANIFGGKAWLNDRFKLKMVPEEGDERYVQTYIEHWEGVYAHTDGTNPEHAPALRSHLASASQAQMKTMGTHYDTSPSDNNKKTGLPENYKVRTLMSSGAATIITFTTHLVNIKTGEMTKLAKKDYPKAEYVLRLPKGFSVYIMGPLASGRHALGKVCLGGEWHSVIIQHESTTDRELSNREKEERMFLVSDISFTDATAARQYLSANKNGPSRRFPSPPDKVSIDLSQDYSALQAALKRLPKQRRNADSIVLCHTGCGNEAVYLDLSVFDDPDRHAPNERPLNICAICAPTRAENQIVTRPCSNNCGQPIHCPTFRYSFCILCKNYKCCNSECNVRLTPSNSNKNCNNCRKCGNERNRIADNKKRAEQNAKSSRKMSTDRRAKGKSREHRNMCDEEYQMIFMEMPAHRDGSSGKMSWKSFHQVVVSDEFGYGLFTDFTETDLKNACKRSGRLKGVKDLQSYLVSQFHFDQIKKDKTKIEYRRAKKAYEAAKMAVGNELSMDAFDEEDSNSDKMPAKISPNVNMASACDSNSNDSDEDHASRPLKKTKSQVM